MQISQVRASKATNEKNKCLAMHAHVKDNKFFPRTIFFFFANALIKLYGTIENITVKIDQ